MEPEHLELADNRARMDRECVALALAELASQPVNLPAEEEDAGSDGGDREARAAGAGLQLQGSAPNC